MTSLWQRYPFLTVGLPFISAVLLGTAVLTDIRKSRYVRPRNERLKEVELSGEKRSLKSLEEELAAWEAKAKAVQDYEMKPVKG